MDRSLIKGMFWTGLVKWASQIVSWATTILVARLLTPEDYGIVGMATAFIGVVSLLNEFGVGITIVSLRHLSEQAVAQLNSLSAILGGAGFLLSAAVAIPLANFYGTPEVGPVVTVMAVTFVFAGFKSVPNALLQKELRFRVLALIDGLQVFVQAAFMVAVAFMGGGYWTLVTGGVIGALVAMVATLVVRTHSFAWPSLVPLKEAITFSSHIVLSRVSWCIQSNADSVITGKVLGQAALGAYGMALSLAMMPVEKIAAVVSQVTTSLFAAVQQDPAAMRRYFVSLTEGFSLVIFPATVGIALVAEEVVPLVLGEKWVAAVPPLQILAFYGAFRAIQTLPPQILFVTGGSRLAMWNALGVAVVLPAAFYLCSRWGTQGIAVSWLIVHPLAAIQTNWFVFGKIQVTIWEYLRALRPALIGCALMMTSVMALKAVMPSAWPLSLRFGAEVLAGAAVYGVTTLSIHGERVRAFVTLIRKGAG
ncbi:MAG: lipopolysaccharide biosynthesis protein [Nitrospira sp.]